MAKGFHVRTSQGQRAEINTYGVQIIEEFADGSEEEVVVVTTSDPDELDRLKAQFLDLMSRVISHG